MADPGVNLSMAMKLIHSSNAKKEEVKQSDPLIKDVLTKIREIRTLQDDLKEAVENGDEQQATIINESIESIRSELKEQNIEGKLEDMEQSVQNIINDDVVDMLKQKIKDDSSDDTIGELVRMLQTGKKDGGDKISKEEEDSLLNVMTGVLKNAGLTKTSDTKAVMEYVKGLKSDVALTNKSIADVVAMNTQLNNQLVDLTKAGETNSYVLAEGLANLSDQEMEMLLKMDELPSHTVKAVEIENRRRKLKDNPLGLKLFAIEESLGKLGKKWDKWGSAMKDPIGFIKPMFQTVGRIISLMWKTIIPTIISMAVSLFTVVLPMALMILGIVLLGLLAIYLIWKFAGNFIKKVIWGAIQVIWEIVKTVAGLIWDYLPVVWNAIKVVWSIVSGAFKLIDALFSGDWAAIGKIVTDIGNAVWDLLMAFGKFIFQHPILGTIVGVLTYMAAKMTFMTLWTKAKEAWDAVKWSWQFLWANAETKARMANEIKDKGMWGRQMVANAWNKTAMMAQKLWNIVFSAKTWVQFGLVLMGLLPIVAIALAVAAIVAFVWYFRKEIWGFIEMVLNWIWVALKFYVNLWSKAFDWIMGGLKIAIDGIWEGMKAAWSFLTSLPDALIGGFKDVLGGIKDALNPFNWFAEGAVVTGPTKAVVGEAGPEAVLPLKGSGSNTLMGVLNEFFDTFLPFFKPLVNFLWDNFKPYLPIMQAVMNAIYSVVYSIISGLSKLPSWLGGDFFASMLSGMAKPKSGVSGSGSVSQESMLFSIISGDISDKPVLGLIGGNKNEITRFDDMKRPMSYDTMNSISKFVSSSSDSMGVPEYARNIQKGMEDIGNGIHEIGERLGKMENNIIGSMPKANTTTQDKQFELSKLISRNSFNGGRI